MPLFLQGKKEKDSMVYDRGHERTSERARQAGAFTIFLPNKKRKETQGCNNALFLSSRLTESRGRRKNVHRDFVLRVDPFIV